MTWAIARRALTVANETRHHGARAALDQPLARFRAEAARVRQGGASTVTLWLGDSLTEAYEPSKRGLRWIDRLASRLNGAKPAKAHYVPAATSTFSTTTAGDWPGDQAPWTYSPAPTGSVAYGADLHAVTVPTGGTATLAFFGDVVNVAYTRTADGPSAAAVTIDGVSVGSINANGSELPGRVATFNPTAGIGDYGSHTLVVTATGAPLVLEGALVHDGVTFGLGVPFGCIYTLAFGHAGFTTQAFVDNGNWATSLSVLGTTASGAASLVGIALGANDFGASLSAQTYRSNLVAIMGKIDTAYGSATPKPGILLVQMPGLPASYMSAAWNAAAQFDPGRVGVLDLAEMMPDAGDDWGLFAAGNGHPDDNGQLWIANTIADAIDPSGPRAPTMPVAGPIIEAADEPARRSNWAAAFSASNPGTYDATAADTGTHERRHRVWLESGTYVCRIRNVATTTAATAEVLVGASSCGTTSTGTSSPNAVEATLANTITIDSPGWYPVTIRKTGAAAGALQFSRLYIRKTG